MARVACYRALKQSGVLRALSPIEPAPPLGLAVPALEPVPATADPSVRARAEALLAGQATFFSCHRFQVGAPPAWLANPFVGTRHPQPDEHWTRIADFSAAGDIKVIWELSRFSWAPVLARAARVSGDARFSSALCAWLEDWWQQNPPNRGPQWKCGQETSLRLLNTLLAARLLGLAPTPGLEAFVEAHCQRIALTMFYAVAQDNNHGTSEAAALWAGGLWLTARDNKAGHGYADQGRALLLDRVAALVMPDGSFSQHSVTYHRMMLDTLSLAEFSRREHRQPDFPATYAERVRAAILWLHSMLDPETGDAPNLGANDGTLPFVLCEAGYRDFRPSVQLAAALFGGAGLSSGPWNEPCAWLGLDPPQTGAREQNRFFADGGYAVLTAGSTRAIVRAPRARFRPAQADALHLDLWHGSLNLLRDGGTYSYADTGDLPALLAGIAGHNTAQFDGRDAMPRLGRFLYGDWLEVDASAVTPAGAGATWQGRYTDAADATHERHVTVEPGRLTVVDQLDGFRQSAVLRWRLAPAAWQLAGANCASPLANIEVEASSPVVRLVVVEGWESRHYLESSPVPVLEIELGSAPVRVTTTVILP